MLDPLCNFLPWNFTKELYNYTMEFYKGIIGKSPFSGHFPITPL